MQIIGAKKMKKTQKNIGCIVITPYLRERMLTYRTGGDSDRPMSYVDVVKGLGISHQTWYRLETGLTVNCSWDTWAPIYKCLITNGLLDPNDVSLMPPDLLRENHADKRGFGQLIDTILAEIMGSDMCAECKVKAYSIISKHK